MRYGFRRAVDSWVKEYSPVLGDTTLPVRIRALNTICDDVERLFDNGKISTTEPASLSVYDVSVIVSSWKKRGDLKISTISRKIYYLQSICLFCSNNAVAFARARYPALFPKESKGEALQLSVDEIRLVIFAVESVPSDALLHWMPSVVALATGARTNEMRLMHVSDFDLNDHKVIIGNPKGRGVWTDSRIVPVRPEFVPVIARYLSSIPDGYLFDNGGVPYSINAFGVWRRRICEDLGFAFDYRVLRATYGQMMLDEGLPIEVVSVLLGHASSRVTETYYARVRRSQAVSRALDLWYGDGSADCSANPSDERDAPRKSRASAGLGEQGGIRTLGLQLRRLPPYPS